MNSEHGEHGKPKPEKDPNYLAYLAMEAELKEKHMGKWVGFYDGKLVAIEENETAALKLAIQTAGTTGVMLKQVLEKEQLINLSPRRITRLE